MSTTTGASCASSPASPPAEADATLSEETAMAIRRELATEVELIERWTDYDLAAWRE